jgi:rubrerythrin
MPENKFSGIENSSPGWRGEPAVASIANMERLFKTLAEKDDRLEPHRYPWACSVCKRVGQCTDQLADCPVCGGKSVHAVMVEGST